MPSIGTNDFVLKNLSALTTKYRLYRILGLNRDPKDERNRNDYYQNCQSIIRRLSFMLRKPVTIIDREETSYLVIPAGVSIMPTSLSITRDKIAQFEALDETFELDYTKRTPENDKICLRFLEFLIQTPLHNHPDLWQPKAGAPFFTKVAEDPESDVLHYMGFSVRPVIAPDGGIALRVHIANKYVSRYPAPAHIRPGEFGKWKGKHFIYHYGHRWYEMRANELSDLNATTYLIPTKDGRRLPLLDFAAEESKKPIPPELSRVKHDSSVFVYYTNRNEERGAISSLCHRVYGPHDRETKQLHRSSILLPWIRRRMAMDFVRRYLSRLSFGNTILEVEIEPLQVPARTFTMPDFKLGNSQVLSVRGTRGAHQVPLEALGATRLRMLKDSRVGFYDTTPLGRQYFIVPMSVLQSWGETFLNGMSREVDSFLRQEHGYEPIVIPYNDRVPRMFLDQSRAILKALDENRCRTGHAVVMIHRLPTKRNHEEDQLAAMVVRELRERYDLTAAVIHTDVGQESYVLGKGRDGEPEYVPHQRSRGKLSGYLQLVALNKVLLLNERWPFVLATPLHADLIIGIDVKHNTAGLVLVDKYGEKIRPLLRRSKQKEKLRADQMEALLLELIRKEAATRRGERLKHIVIHRDGRLWPSERDGIQPAFARLKREGTQPEDGTLTILEIPKSAQSPLRLFDVRHVQQSVRVENPQIGQYEIRGDEGYVCTTGRAFPRRGTSLPLHVRKIEGPLSLEECLEDIFFLTALAWTKPDDCRRDPITTKLNDLYLSDEATIYDAESLEYSLAVGEEIEEEDGGEEAIA
ncbi:MAG: hypothetical protein JST85_22530 [Acidobacteria bacterium]|nr:hypothetical protein [Acidobacteriota bacterium]